MSNHPPKMAHTETDQTSTMRIDKWLWCARFYKTRAIAVEAIHKGHVKVNGTVAKPSKEVRAQDTVELLQAQTPRTVAVLGMAATRGPAPVAQQMYEETADSIRQREVLSEQRRLAPEPANSLQAGRPTKKDRRDMQELRSWNDRWSAQ